MHKLGVHSASELTQVMALATKSAMASTRPSFQANRFSGEGVLTSREREVAGLLAHGMSNLQIAERLGMAEATVRTHRQRILKKLGLRRIAQLASGLAHTG